MKWFALALMVLVLYLQYRLWFDQGGYTDLAKLQSQIETQKQENARLIERNRVLAAEVDALKNKSDAVEERARTDLGMIKEGETFIMVVPQEPTKSE